MNKSEQQPAGSTLPRPGRPYHLRRRFITLLGSVLLVALLAGETGMLYFVSRNEQRAWQDRQREAARHAGHVVADFRERAQDSLTLVNLLDSDHLAAEPYMMRDFVAQNPALLEIIRLDARGAVIASACQDTPVLANLFTIPQSNWFLEAKGGESYLSNVQISADDQPYVIMAMPSPDAGVVAARLRMTLLWDVVADIKFGTTGQAYVINQGGQIIAHSDPEVALAKTSLQDHPELIALLQAPRHEWNGTYTNFEGVKVVGATAQVPGTEWVVITELSQLEATAVSRLTLLLLAGEMLVATVVVMGVTTRFMERLIFQPLERLQSGAERIGRGDLSHRIDVDRQDEVGRVAHAFNEMARRLHEREEQLTARTAALTTEIAERRRAEERLQRYATELERANADVVRASADIVRASDDLRRFTYVASHNLRGPLVNLNGFAAELRAALALVGSVVITTLPHLDEKKRQIVTTTLEEGIPEALGFIDASVSDLNRLVNAIQKLSSLSHQELRLKPTDMNGLVQETLNRLAHQIEERQVTVTVGPLPEVVADQAAMAEIMTNLLKNALAYLDPERPGEIEISAERNHDETLFRVQDNGHGIAAEDMDKVFAPFRRVGRHDVPGEGMGLPYVQTLVRRHGGRIWCESELGVGTTFTFTISDHPAEGDSYA